VPRVPPTGSSTQKLVSAILAKLDRHPDLILTADTAAATPSRTQSNMRDADYPRVPFTITDIGNVTTDEETTHPRIA